VGVDKRVNWPHSLSLVLIIWPVLPLAVVWAVGSLK
jgi:nitrate reductase NapE component